MSTMYRVYRNLNNGKISIMNAKTRLVVGHADAVILDHASFEVNEKGRQRVIEEGRKNVHAFVKGFISDVAGFEAYKNREIEPTLNLDAMPVDRKAYLVKYNPFKSGSFMVEDGDDWKPIQGATRVGVSSNGKMAAMS